MSSLKATESAAVGLLPAKLAQFKVKANFCTGERVGCTKPMQEQPPTAPAGLWGALFISCAEGFLIAHSNLGLQRSTGSISACFKCCQEKKGTWVKPKLAKRRIAKPRLSINQLSESHETGIKKETNTLMSL